MYLDANLVYDLLLETPLVKTWDPLIYDSRGVRHSEYLYKLAFPRDEPGQLQRIRDAVRRRTNPAIELVSSQFALLEAYSRFFSNELANHYVGRNLLPLPYAIKWILRGDRQRAIIRRSKTPEFKNHEFADTFTATIPEPFWEWAEEQGVRRVEKDAADISSELDYRRGKELVEYGMNLADVFHLFIAEQNHVEFFATRDADFTELANEIEGVFKLKILRAPGGLLDLVERAPASSGPGVGNGPQPGDT